MSSTKITEAVFQPLSKLQVLGGQHDDWTNSAYLPNRFVYDIELRTTQCHERCLQRMQKKKKNCVKSIFAHTHILVCDPKI
jgi:hypothetical protein